MARNSLKSVLRLIESVQEELPVEQKFLAELKRSVEMTENKNVRLPSQTYKPSSMNCMRASYYQIIGQPPVSEASYNLVAICETGTDRHERIQNAVAGMRENGMDCDYIDVADYVKQRDLDWLEVVEKKGNETKLYHKTLNISFLCDGIIRYQGKYYIIEFKTEGSSKFFSRKQVDPKHYKQAITYSMSLGIDQVMFIYICRDTLDMKSFIFNVTDDMKQEVLGYIEQCDEYIKQKRVPPVDPNMDQKIVCTYCAYREQCRKEG